VEVNLCCKLKILYRNRSRI